ncbi:MAG: hypothetical protein DRR08_26145 [Candidatus Parabeggiatoa sp. nov. 2]|nr:MAG: hypothetical protein B6247_27725 [Beggiatoa sp. 4572_84]RKZ54735.1 MAG: hypothetical protein DRR08_26145 [Gammaproteobacteria bacterium]
MGYFQNLTVLSNHYVLSKEENGLQTSWMSLAPMELESSAPHVAAANGVVVVMGAGMGVVLYNMLKRPEVEKVTVVERDPKVIDLLYQAIDIQSWAGIDKLTIEVMDAFDYIPTEKVNYIFVDIWVPVGDKQALPDTQRIQLNVKANVVSWWGQEIDFLRWFNQNRPQKPASLNHYLAWAKEINLPLIEQNNPEYVSWIMAVAQSMFYQNIRRREQKS